MTRRAFNRWSRRISKAVRRYRAACGEHLFGDSAEASRGYLLEHVFDFGEMRDWTRAWSTSVQRWTQDEIDRFNATSDLHKMFTEAR